LLGTLTPTAAAQLLVQLLAALAHAHERSVVHGALVPANVLRDGAGGIRVTDFGATPHADADAGYRAPELRPGQGSAAGDMYAAGQLFLRSLAPVSAGASAPPLPTGLWPVVESLTAADVTRRMPAKAAWESLVRAGQPSPR